MDTHTFLWWLDGDRRLTKKPRGIIADATTVVFVSAATAWEITKKHRLGKLPGAAAVAADVIACVRSQGFTPLAITLDHGQRAGMLPGPHRDPFDRMLIAQAQADRLAVVSNEEIFDSYGVTRLW
ncbi:MAG TPA: type II toxin-antitoxin system VapC family toxin [Gemmatimonadaceae bacterium]|nr:type II toxin-antitoxin system VapC family toxin [Gemmatimonadaceae bacterium]